MNELRDIWRPDNCEWVTWHLTSRQLWTSHVTSDVPTTVNELRDIGRPVNCERVTWLRTSSQLWTRYVTSDVQSSVKLWTSYDVQSTVNELWTSYFTSEVQKHTVSVIWRRHTIPQIRFNSVIHRSWHTPPCEEDWEITKLNEPEVTIRSNFWQGASM